MNALQHAAKHLQTRTGINFKLISAPSLRPGGATALLCAHVNSDAICLLGRWKSNAMLRYLRIQATVLKHNYAEQMLQHGSYTFVAPPNKFEALPDQTLHDITAIITHEELYEDNDA